MMTSYQYSKKLFLRLLLTLVVALIGFLAVVDHSYAQFTFGDVGSGEPVGFFDSNGNQIGSGGTAGDFIGGSANLGFGLDPVDPNDPSLPYTVVDSNGNVTEVNSGNPGQPQGSGGSYGWFVKSVWNTIGQLFYIFFISIPAMLAGLAGMLLNLSIEKLVIGMSTFINQTTGIGFAINMLWQVIRDTMNILFIFGLIYIGIKTILNSEDSGTRRTLGLLIAAALFINFSLFIAKAIIDFSNILAVQINKLMVVTAASSENITTELVINYGGITGAFFEAIGLSQITGTSIADMLRNTTDSFTTLTTVITFMAGSMILFLVLAMVFFAGAIMVLTRFVALVIYMIFSPVMFLGWILPAFNQYTTMWFNGFLKNAFFAPAYLFMLYLSLITVTQLRMSLMPGRQINYLDAITSKHGAFEIIMVYALAIAMLVASIIVAQKMSIAGAGTGMSMLKGARARIQGAILRNTVGAASYGAGKIYDRFQSSSVGSGIISRGLRKTLNVATLGTTSDRTINRTLKKGAAAKYDGDSYESIREEDKKRQATLLSQSTVRQNQADISEGVKQAKLRDAGKAYNTDAIAKMEEVVSSLRTSQLEEMDDAVLESIAGVMGGQQFKDFIKSEKINDTTRAKVQTARSKSVEKKLNGAYGKADKTQLTALGSAYFQDKTKAALLSEKQIDDSDFSETTKSEIKKRREEGLTDLYESNPAAVFFKNHTFTGPDAELKKDADIAALPSDILTDKNAIPYLTGGALREMLKTLSPTARGKIRNNITRAGALGQAPHPSATAWLGTPDSYNF